MVFSKDELRNIELINWTQQSLLTWLGVGLASLIGIIELVDKIGDLKLFKIILYECLLFLLILSIDRIIDHLENVFKWKDELEKKGWIFPKPEKRYSTKILNKILRKLIKDSRVAKLVYFLLLMIFNVPLIQDDVKLMILTGVVRSMENIKNVSFSIIPIIGNKLNIGQELFLLLFSILYGVMLQSLPGGLWPLASSVSGKMNKFGNIVSDKKYKCIWRKRTFISFLIFNLGPSLYLWGILSILTFIRFPSLWCNQVFFIVAIFFTALGVFGFYRIFYVVVSKYWNRFYIDMIDTFEERDLSYNAKAHFIWACIYMVIFPSLLIISHLFFNA